MINKTHTHVFRPAALALLVALAAACGKDTPITPDPDHGQGTPIAIGQLPVTAAAADHDAAAGTYWRNGDAILVTATSADAGTNAGSNTPADPAATTLTAVYTYKDGSWAHNGNGAPLYVEHISHPITIQSWGGKPSSGIYDDGNTGAPADPTAYTNQSDPVSAPDGYTSGDRYRRNDHLLCPNATLTARTLSGELAHSRVDFVLKITDGTATDANGNPLNALPANAVLMLNADGNAATPSGAPVQEVITAYRQGKTTTPDATDAVTTFRAYIDLKDVPGITLSTTRQDAATRAATSGTVRDRSLLGTLTYTMPTTGTTTGTTTGPGSGSNGSSTKTLKIYYSITSGTDADGTPGASGNGVLIEAGKRITVSATFADLSYLDATASLEPWKDNDAGDAGTSDMNMVEKIDDATGNTIYEIYSAKGLKKFADLVNGTGDYTTVGKNLNANARLMKDIDLSTVLSAAKGNWTPMGKDYDNAYLGCFDGKGHTVKGLYIDGRNADFTGLFGYIGKNATIRHLRVEAVKISSSSNFTGVLAGLNYGTIIDCQATGDVTGFQFTGGLVGWNYGTITACYATGITISTAKSSGGSTGGLVGSNSYGTITACYATGNVTGGEASGGLVGENRGTITACYATGNASGGSSIGGLVGWNNSTITACYATGNASGTNSIGGLVGSNNNGTLQHCATSQSSICGSYSNGPTPGSQSGLTTFFHIYEIVASQAAQDAWGKSIGPDGLVQSPADADGRILNGPWNSLDPDADASASPRAIWKAPVNGPGPNPDLITAGHLHLWWQPNP